MAVSSTKEVCVQILVRDNLTLSTYVLEVLKNPEPWLGVKEVLTVIWSPGN